MNALIVDPQPHSADMLAIAFGMHWPHARAHIVTRGRDVMDAFFRDVPDVVVLASDLPDRNALDVLSSIRRHSDVPVFMLCDCPEELREIHMLQHGADGCLGRSFSPLVIVARIDSVLRRASAVAHAEDLADFVCGDFKVSYRSQCAMMVGEVIDLSPIEFRLLAALTRNAGRVMTHQTLIDKVWGMDSHASTDQLKVVMSRMRGKLKQPGVRCPIETVRGVGYRIVMPTPGVIEMPSRAMSTSGVA
jgi:two-component system, OmpR family, KDP operon response regulator KdpE